MKKFTSLFLIITCAILSTDAQALLNSSRKSLSCDLRRGQDCKEVAVFLRDTADNCISDPQGQPNNCRKAFCTANCAVPAHQTITPDTHELCVEHCVKVDLMNHKLQERLTAAISGAWSEEEAKAQYPDPVSLQKRNGKEKANFDAMYGNAIAQTLKSAWDRAIALEEAKYYKYKYDTAQTRFEGATKFWDSTKKSLENNGFTPEELKVLLADPIAAETKIKSTPPEQLQIGAAKALAQLKKVVLKTPDAVQGEIDKENILNNTEDLIL